MNGNESTLGKSLSPLIAKYNRQSVPTEERAQIKGQFYEVILQNQSYFNNIFKRYENIKSTWPYDFRVFTDRSDFVRETFADCLFPAKSTTGDFIVLIAAAPNPAAYLHACVKNAVLKLVRRNQSRSELSDEEHSGPGRDHEFTDRYPLLSDDIKKRRYLSVFICYANFNDFLEDYWKPDIHRDDRLLKWRKV